MFYHYDYQHLLQRLLLATYRFSKSTQESVIVSAVIPVDALGKQGEIETEPVLKRLFYLFYVVLIG